MFEVSARRKFILAASVLFFVLVLIPFVYHVVKTNKPEQPKTKLEIHNELEGVAARMEKNAGTTTMKSSESELNSISERMKSGSQPIAQ